MIENNKLLLWTFTLIPRYDRDRISGTNFIKLLVVSHYDLLFGKIMGRQGPWSKG